MMMNNEQKQYQLNFLQMNLATLTEKARQCYEKEGRGHLMVVCKTDKRTPRGVKPGTSWYITEQKNATLPDPDMQLEAFVAIYNPDTEAVISLYTGTMYSNYLIRIPAAQEVAIAV